MVINLNWRFRLDIRQNFSPENTAAVQQTAQRNCAVPILRGFQNLTGQSPEQPGAADPVLGQEVQSLLTQTVIQSQG